MDHEELIDLLQRYAESSDPEGVLAGRLAGLTFAIHGLLLFASDPEARILAAATLARLDSTKADVCMPVLVEGLRSHDEAHRVYSAYAIRNLGPLGASAVPALLDVLHDQEHDTARYHAIQAIEAIGPAAVAASPNLIEIVRAVRADMHGIEVLHALGAACALGEIGDAAALPALKECLGLDADDDALVDLFKQEAAEALRKIGE